MGKDDGDVDFDGYEITTVNPGVFLLYSTFACCILLFLIAFLGTPGKILHPIWKRIREYDAWCDDMCMTTKRDEILDGIEANRTRSEDSNGNLKGKMLQSQVENIKKHRKWKEAYDMNTGKTYYYHEETKKRTWRKPREMYESWAWKQAKKRMKRQDKDGKSEPLVPLDEECGFIEQQQDKNEKIEPLVPHNEESGSEQRQDKDGKSEPLVPHNEDFGLIEKQHDKDGKSESIVLKSEKSFSVHEDGEDAGSGLLSQVMEEDRSEQLSSKNLAEKVGSESSMPCPVRNSSSEDEKSEILPSVEDQSSVNEQGPNDGDTFKVNPVVGGDDPIVQGSKRNLLRGISNRIKKEGNDIIENSVVPPIDSQFARGKMKRIGTVMTSKKNLSFSDGTAWVPAPDKLAPPPTKNEIARESRKILGLGIPWMFQSVISDGSSIMTIMMISQFMGLRDMLVYSNVWFMVYLAFVMNDAWYGALYKHVNVSAALCTEEGYIAAGRYIKIGIIGNIILSIPVSVLAVKFVPNILYWIGYGEEVAEVSRLYTLVAVVNNVFDTTIEIIDCLLDIDGHATFGAVYDFWDSAVQILLCFVFIVKYTPSLFFLGLFHFALGIISTMVYFAITHKYCRWFDKFSHGLSTSMFKLPWPQVKKMVKMTNPMIMEAIIGNIEHTVFTIFAAHQGTAEAATWILLSYVWGIVGIVPDSFGAAASCRVARLISKGDVQMAKAVSKRAMKQAVYISLVCASTVYYFQEEIVYCFSTDETLDQMLLEIIPYVTLCYPFMTLGGIAEELNDALHLFKRAMVTMAIVTITIMVPIGYVMTYILQYNIEGLASAQCIGYTAVGVINIIFFVNANWEKAVRKANEIADAGITTEKDLTDEYNDYDWDELPAYVKEDARKFGYDKETWDNGSSSSDSEYGVYNLKPLTGSGKAVTKKTNETADAGITTKPEIGNEYNDYDWVDLPDDVKKSAEKLGYNKETWDNGSSSNDSECGAPTSYNLQPLT